MSLLHRPRPTQAAPDGSSRRARIAATFVAGTLALSAAAGTAAQSATPSGEPDQVTAADCTVEPRSEPDLRALFQEVAATPLPADVGASPTPAVVLEGPPADEQTVREINATWRAYVACLSAGDQPRMFALVSDDMVRRQFVIDRAFGVTEEALFAYLAATPVPVQPDEGVAVDPITDAQVLPDGRVAVVGPGENGRGDVRVFVKEGDRWLLDNWYDLS